MLKDLCVLVVVVLSGFIYYKFSVAKPRDIKTMAFCMKIFLLIVSFVLAFADSDYIRISDEILLGGHAPIMLLIAVEIADAFAERRKKH